MTTIRMKFQELKPAFPLFYLSLMGFLCMLTAQGYLGLGFQPWNCLSFMGIIFSVYTLNRFTDTTEDFTNDIERLLFFQRKKSFLILACAVLAASVGFLVVTGKLNWMHLLLLAMGCGYSFRLIPWYSAGRGLHFARIKEMTFLKNLSVSFLWGASVFVVPILWAHASYDRFTVGMLAAGLFLSTLNNTLFDDILDETGDRVAGIKTLPTAWGGRASQLMLISLDLLWLAGVGFCFARGRIDAPHAAFLALLSVYPFLYMGLKAWGRPTKGWIDFLAECDLLVFSAGMALLTILR